LQEYEAFQPDPQYLDSAYRYLNIQKYNGQNTIWFNAIINYYFMRNDYNSIIKMVENLGNSVVITKYLNEQDYTNYDGWTSYRIGQSFENTGNLLIAKYFYENAINLAKYNLDFQNKYGTLLSEEGDFVNAKKVFGFIISEYPYHVSAHINLGYVYSRTGDMKLAKNEYEEALSYDPDNIQALINISGICIFQNEKEEAKSYIERILKLEPDNKKALLLRSRIN
jgi:Tfp pilus assembly protein PilF